MGLFWKRLSQKLKLALKGEKFLCDSCKYDWGNACTRKERPNASYCLDYKRK